jgi:hypothetical protein
VTDNDIIRPFGYLKEILSIADDLEAILVKKYGNLCDALADERITEEGLEIYNVWYRIVKATNKFV